MTRRTVFSRILGAVGFAAVAKALPSYPEAGQKRVVVALSRIHEQDIAGEVLAADGYEHLQFPIAYDDPGVYPDAALWDELKRTHTVGILHGFGRDTDKIHWIKLGSKT